MGNKTEGDDESTIARTSSDIFKVSFGLISLAIAFIGAIMAILGTKLFDISALMKTVLVKNFLEWFIILSKLTVLTGLVTCFASLYCEIKRTKWVFIIAIILFATGLIFAGALFFWTLFLTDDLLPKT